MQDARVPTTRVRFERMQLNDVRDEFRRAELAFVTAKRFLADPQAREVVGRVADALGRTGRAIDDVEKGAAAHPALESLEGVHRFDPSKRLLDFLPLAAHSVALAGRTLERSGVHALTYWGRVLTRLGETMGRLTEVRKAV